MRTKALGFPRANNSGASSDGSRRMPKGGAGIGLGNGMEWNKDLTGGGR